MKHTHSQSKVEKKIAQPFIAKKKKRRKQTKHC